MQEELVIAKQTLADTERQLQSSEAMAKHLEGNNELTNVKNQLQANIVELGLEKVLYKSRRSSASGDWTPSFYTCYPLSTIER